jgi:putative DNA primase/helicase
MSISLAPRMRINADDQDLEQVTCEAWDAVLKRNKPPTLFRYGNRIVRIEDGDTGEAIAREVTVDRMIHYLARAISWYKERKNTDVPARPPREVAKDMLATPNNRLPILNRITRVPVFNPDTTLMIEPGYNESTGTLYLPPRSCCFLPVADSPASDELALAVDFIGKELLGDFLFVDAASRAHAFAAILLPYARGMIRGATPFHLIEKSTPGTGGTLLAQVSTQAFLGRWPSSFAPPRDEAEWRRVLLSRLREGPTVVFIDNIDGQLASSSLASAITCDYYEDRIVGQSDMLLVPVLGLWLGTGNNPELSRELDRRTVRIRLDARMERPELRTGFRYPNLKLFVEENRAVLVWAAHTIIQSWIAAGAPKALKTLGMFETWAGTMGGILAHAGIEGFLEGFGSMDSGFEDAALHEFIRRWWQAYRDSVVTTSELLPFAADGLDIGDGDENSRKIRLGRLLYRYRDRCIEGVCLQHLEKKQNSRTWRLVSIPGGQSK